MRKIFHNQKNPVKRHKSRFYIPSNLRRQLSKRQHSEIQPRLPSFQRELQKIMLAYFNIFQYMHGPRVTHLTLLHLDPDTHQHIRKESIFPIGLKTNGTTRVQFETATYIFFNQWKIICSKLFKLKTDGDLTHHQHTCLTTASH